MLRHIVGAGALTTLLASVNAQYGNSSELPVVDLGYQQQRATGFNESGQYYDFANIRYAAPPVGDLRFRAPQPPAENRSVIDDGTTARICPQGTPGWLIDAFGEEAVGATTSPAISEDCLFLDVAVPQEIFDNAGNGTGAPVLVWIYGGGYTLGAKSEAQYDPIGLLKRADAVPTTGGIIYVAMNYRLGAFGFSSGPSLQADGDANAGLLDQRFALEWIQEHISKFGGNPNNVTVIGESAGGGSIMYQLTAHGGYNGPAPFQQAIIQSPGFIPNGSPRWQEERFQNFLNAANVSTIAELRQLSSEALIQANIDQILQSAYGQFTYEPAVDGDFAPGSPAQLLAIGNFDTSVRIMDGQNENEGILFTDPRIVDEATTRSSLRESIPTATDENLDFILNDLYPATFDATQPYTTYLTRAALIVSEFAFICNNYFLDKAYGNQTYSYYFTVGRALHGDDIAYTFFPGNLTTPGEVNATVAIAMQEYFTSFAQTGRPVGPLGTQEFVRTGGEAMVLNLDDGGIGLRRDPAANRRCDWWEKNLFL